MLNAIYEIGKNISGEDLSKDKFIKNICLKLEEKNYQGQKQHVVLLNFNTKTGKIEIDFEEVNAGGKDSSKEYLWIGDTIRHKLYCPVTTKRIDRILTTTLPELKKNRVFEKTKMIDEIFKIFFNKGELQVTRFDFFVKKCKDIDKRIKDIIKKVEDQNIIIEKIEIINDVKELWNEVSKDKLKLDTKGDINILKKSIQEKINYVGKEKENLLIDRYKNVELLIKDLFKFELGFDYNKDIITKSSTVSLYTLKKNGEVLTQNNDYFDFIFKEKISSAFQKSYKEKNVCSVCKKGNIKTTDYFTNLGFKYYITDKLGFSSNLEGKYERNFNMCETCYKYLMVSETFTNDYLKTRIGHINTFVIPDFIFQQQSNFDFKTFAGFLKTKTAKVSDLKKSQSEVEDFITYENQKQKYLINYLFFEKEKSEFKVLKLIKDIPPTRINLIIEKEESIMSIINDNYEENRNLYINLNALWKCVPLKKYDKKSHKYTGISRYLDLVDNIFSDRPVKYHFLIYQGLETIRIIKHETHGNNIWPEDKKSYKPDLTNKIIQLNFLLLFFKKLNLIGGDDMENTKDNEYIAELIPEEIQNYWNDIEIYNNARKALFLIGYLMGEIASKQQSIDIKNKPILNKINFQGMGKEKVTRLSSEIFEKLRQNKILDFNEEIFSAAKILLDENINNWTLSNQENVFYILSGYAYSNYLMRKRSRNKFFSDLEEKMKLLEKLKSEGKETTEVEEAINQSKEEAEKKHYYEARKILKSINN